VEHSFGVPSDWPTAFVGEGRLSITACGRIARTAIEHRQPVALSIGGEDVPVRGAILERSPRAGWLWLTLSSEPLDCTDNRPSADARVVLSLDDRAACDSATLFGNLFEPQRTIGGAGLLDCRVTTDPASGSYRVAATSTDGRAVVRLDGDVAPLDCR
jgi:hypothetical protein